jgi:Tfp pilus assembly protein PilX
MKMHPSRRGGALVVAMVTLLVVTLIAGSVVRSLVASHRQARQHEGELQAQWLADAALVRAAAQLSRDADYERETWRPAMSDASAPEEGGVAIIRVEQVDAQPGQRRLIVEARYPDHEWRRVSVRRELLIGETTMAGRADSAENAP